jgi:hypothetical protein
MLVRPAQREYRTFAQDSRNATKAKTELTPGLIA